MHTVEIILVVVVLVHAQVMSSCYGEDEKIRYDGYQVWRLKCHEPSHCDLSTITKGQKVEVFRRLQGTSDILVSPDDQDTLRPVLESFNVSYTVIQHNIQKIINDQMYITQRETNSSLERFKFNEYHPLDEIEQWMRRIARENTDIVQLVDIGKSYEGRRMRALKIGAASTSNKDGIWIQAGVHAREWVAHASAVYIANQLITNYVTDPIVTKLLDRFDWYILPALNPDGYVYTWETDRLWRKTRSVNAGTKCMGVDGNRNYGYKWGGAGASDDPCDNEYMGPFPYSEPEIHSIVSFLSRSSVNFKAFLDLHSFYQLWMYPWCYTEELTPDSDYKKQDALARLAVETIEGVHGMQYTSGSYASTLYISAGTSPDWAYGQLGILYSYTVELRDRGQYGFLLPECEILPTAEELYAAVRVLGQYILNEDQNS
ncbi:carboxypeptidase B-like [Glandiceps talaboti]